MEHNTHSGALPEKYCIVGAGPSGLIAARALTRAGVTVDVLERNGDLGGLWNIDHPTSPLYESCNYISDRDHSGFIGYPMPKTLPEFPTGHQILDYIQQFATHFDLDRFVRVNAEVVNAVPCDTSEGSYWLVTLADGEQIAYRGVIWACGQQQMPQMPALDGADDFEGRLIHSADYKLAREFANKRVLVVGAGNSGVDIACDGAIHGSHAFLSMRRDYWFFPKRLFGQPLGSFLDRSALVPPGFPPIAQMTREELFEFIVSTVGDNSALGLATPTDKVGSTVPIMNDQVMHQISHGRLEAKPDVVRLTPTSAVFADGSVEPVDVVVLATGFTVDIPWLSEDLYDRKGGEPDFQLGTFSRKAEGLYAVGMNHFIGHTLAIWDQLAQLIAADALSELRGKNSGNIERLKRDFHPELQSDDDFLNVARNVRLMDVTKLPAVLDEIRSSFHIDIPTNPDNEFYAALERQLTS